MISKLLSLFRPSPDASVAAARDRAKAMAVASHQEAMRIARLDRATRKWNPGVLSGTQQALGGADLWQARMRDLQINGAQIKRVEQLLADLVVGPGLKSFTDPFAEMSFGDLRDLQEERLFFWLDLALLADRRFNDWAESLESSAEGNLSFYEMQTLMLTECANQGDAFLLRCSHTTRRRHGIHRCWQLIEKEQLDKTKDQLRHSRKSGDRNEICNGIEFNAMGRPVAYHVLQSHPGDQGGGSLWESERIPADRMIHLQAFHRPSQRIGVTWWSAMAQDSLDKQRFLATELATAIKCSLFAAYAAIDSASQQNLGGDPDEDDPDYGTASDDRDYYLGTDPLFAVFDEGGKMEMVESERPSPNAESFFNIVDQAASGAAGFCDFRANNKYHKTNYSGIKAAFTDDDAHLATIASWLCRRAVEPVRLDWQREAGTLGLLGISQLEYDRLAYALERFDHVGPGRQLLEPARETDAILGNLRGGLTTFKRECARRGLHWLEVMRSRHLFNRITAALDVEFDWSKGNGGNTSAGDNGTGANGQEDDEEATARPFG